MKLKRFIAAIIAALMGIVFIPSEIITDEEIFIANAVENTDKHITNVLMDNYSTWNKMALMKNDYAAVGFLDIDFDNELELVVENTAGTGLFTSLEFYKVNGNTITKLNVPDFNTFPDIVSNGLKLYRNNNGKMEYYGYDDSRGGVGYSERTYCSFVFDTPKNSVIRTDYFAKVWESVYNNDTKQNEENYYWYDYSSNSKISEADYNQLEENTMNNLSDLNLSYSFVDIRKLSSTEEVRQALVESYNTFNHDNFGSINIDKNDNTPKNWRNLYLDTLLFYMNSNSDVSNARFELVNIDNNEIPELLIATGNAHMDKVNIYTVFENKLCDLGLFGEYGGIGLKKNGNLILSGGVYLGGIQTNTYSKIKSGEVELIIKFFCDDTTYKINDEIVSKEEYAKAKEKAEIDYGISDCNGYGPDYGINHKFSEEEINKTLFGNEEDEQFNNESYLIDYYIEQMQNNSYGFVNSSSSKELNGLVHNMDEDDAVINYKVLKAIADSVDGKYDITKDMFQQDLAVQSIFAEILCNPNFFTNMGDKYFEAANKKTNDLLDAISVCQSFNEIDNIKNNLNKVTASYDIKAELNKILLMSDHTSQEFINAKNTWLIKANEYVNETNMFKQLFSELDLIGYSIEIGDLAINNLKDLYIYCQFTAGYEALNNTMKEAIDCFMKQFMMKRYMTKDQYLSYYDMRCCAVYAAFANYYQILKNNNNNGYKEYISEMMKEDFEKISTRAGAIAAEKIIIDIIIQKTCPELYAVLKGAKIALDVGLIIWDKTAKMGDRTLARDMCYNYMIFQDVIYSAMRNEQTQGNFAYRLVNDHNSEALELYECGFSLYKAIYTNTLMYGKQYYEYRSVRKQDIFGQPTDNWIFTEYARFLSFEIDKVKDMRMIQDADYRVTGDFYNNCSSYTIACPVSIQVLHDGTEVALITENGVNKCTDSKIIADVLVDPEQSYAYKFIIVPNEYKIIINGFADGMMNFEKIIFKDEDTTSISYRNDINIKNGTIISEQNDNNNITNALLIDLDGNGKTNKTSLTVNKIGDVNGDNIIDGRDATAVLTYYAITSTSENNRNTSFCTEYADYNKDRVIDGRDATAILTFYAKSSTN